MRKHADNAANVGRVSTRQMTPAHGDVGLREEAANPTYGGMAGEWKDITLGDFVALQRGHDLTEPERRPGHVPVIGSAGQNGFHDTALAKGPGIVIGRSGASFGQVHFCATDYWPHNTGLYVTDFKGNDPRFAYYFLKAIDFDRYNSGSAQPSLNRNFIYPIPICVPEPDEQKAIAHILGTLDDKIELNRRMNATLEAMARAIFQNWFVDFDPVRAKLDGRKPAGLDATTAALFPAHFQESSLGHIPQGWEVCPLADKIELLSGGTPKTGEPDYWDGDIPWFSVKDAPTETDVWVIHTEKRVTELGISNSAAQVFPEKTTIITARGTVGKLALTGTPMAMNQSCYGVRGITGYGNYFTYYSLRAATAQLQQHTHGTVFDTITRQTFETLNCIFPPPKLTAAFDLAVEPLLEQIRANLQQSRTLATLRDALLPKLLSGELTTQNLLP
jgi:type I restriction enzyme, S subunit